MEKTDSDRKAGPLAGRVALVTGGARRIGRQFVLDLARCGANVIIHHHRSEAEAKQTAEEAASFGVRVALVSGDLSDPQVPATIVSEAEPTFGPLSILINNASVFARVGVLETDLQQWQRHQDINLTAPFLLSQAFARQLPDDCEGDIVNLNDIRGLRPGADHFAYTVSKVGLHGLTLGLARAFAPRIRVNELALGAVLPPELAPESYIHTLRDEIPLRRFPQLEDVGKALLFLLENRSITGQTITIDGGRLLA